MAWEDMTFVVVEGPHAGVSFSIQQEMNEIGRQL